MCCVLCCFACLCQGCLVCYTPLAEILGFCRRLRDRDFTPAPPPTLKRRILIIRVEQYNFRMAQIESNDRPPVPTSRLTVTDLPLFTTAPARDIVVARERRRLGASRVIRMAPRVGGRLPNHCSEPRARARTRRCSVARGRAVFQETDCRSRLRATLSFLHPFCQSAWGFGPRLGEGQ